MIPVLITFTRNPVDGSKSFSDSIVRRTPVDVELIIEKLNGSSISKPITSMSGKQYFATNVVVG